MCEFIVLLSRVNAKLQELVFVAIPMTWMCVAIYVLNLCVTIHMSFIVSIVFNIANNS